MTKEKLMEWGLTEEQANKVMEDLIVTLLQLYNTHAELGRFTHSQLAAHTHDQLRNEVLN